MEHFPSTIPVLPIRNAVLFPSVAMPLVVGRERSVLAVGRAETTDGLIVVVAQSVLTPGDPRPEDLHLIGTLCKIDSIALTETGSRQIVVTGIARYRAAVYELDSEGFMRARGEVVSDVHGSDLVRGQALFNNLKETAKEVLELLPGATEPLAHLIDRVDDPAYLTYICSAYINLPLSQKQELLETVQVDLRIEILLGYMRKEREVLTLQREIREKMAERLNKAQREALLREQLRTIRTELGEDEGSEAAEELDDKLRTADLPAEAFKQANEELKRLKNLPSASAEYHVIRSYLEWVVALPWREPEPSIINLAQARRVLDEDHYGLHQVKKRIIQFLAVAKLKNNQHGPILCLVGPPGVGKTSLGQSIARALDRKFVRASLGGVRDEAEIRGHRRTYVGAMPGRIIQSLKRIGTRNPVMILDEVDKLRADFHGDPSAAMLEVLDPEQNKTFTDHYLDMPFDLSQVFFIATANVLDPVPPAMHDRMEVIELNGYTSEEKFHIAKEHLIPKVLRDHGLQAQMVEFPEETLRRLITHYTREAGVRELQRKIAALFRWAAEQLVEDKPIPIDLGLERMSEILGPERFHPESAHRTEKPGVATGLAWTPHGGEILYIEAAALPSNKSHLFLTGQLGDVMKESAQIALSLVRETMPSFDFGGVDLHVHVPAGGIPKDGPSAGVPIFCSLLSLVRGQRLDASVGMTGEITLRGAVLPVGGVKEKVLAAHRAGLKCVILPARNRCDLTDVPAEIRTQMDFRFVENIDEIANETLISVAGQSPASPKRGQDETQHRSAA